MLKTAVIIAGGEGTRLGDLAKDRPKTLVNVAGKPLLYWTINWLKSQGIDHLVVGVAYKKEKIYEFLKENNNFDIDINVSEHTVEGGTAQAFKLAIQRYVTDENFVAMNSDELTNMSLARMIDRHLLKKPLVTMALAPFPANLSIVDVDEDGRVSAFTYGKKLPHIPVSNGIYIFNKGILSHIPETGSIENTAFLKLVGEKNILAHHLAFGEEQWATVNVPKDIPEAERMLKKWGRVQEDGR